MALRKNKLVEHVARMSDLTEILRVFPQSLEATTNIFYNSSDTLHSNHSVTTRR